MAKIGYVYIIRNDEHLPNRFKVGQTYDLDKRINELNSETSNIGKFYLIAKFPVDDANIAEKACHEALKDFRKAKEFFDGPEEEITHIVRGICECYVPEAFSRTDLKEQINDLEAKSNRSPEEIEALNRAKQILEKAKVKPESPEPKFYPTPEGSDLKINPNTGLPEPTEAQKQDIRDIVKKAKEARGGRFKGSLRSISKFTKGPGLGIAGVGIVVSDGILRLFL